jgi:hypothetical protein
LRAWLASVLASLLTGLVLVSAHAERGPLTHPHGLRRSKLDSLHTFIDVHALPKRGIAVKVGGLDGDSEIIIDADAATLRERDELMSRKHSDTTRKLSAAQLDKLMKLADAAWREEPSGPMSDATDVREDLIVIDGDELFFLSGYPITVSEGAKTGRPAASDAMRAIYAALRP